MKKRNLLMLLLGGMMMTPIGSNANPDGDGKGMEGDDEHLVIHRSPINYSYAFITYYESNGSILVTFNSAIDEAEILVYQNGMEVDYQVIDATAGMQVPITLSAYGSGEFVIQVKSGSTLLATLNVTM